MSKFHETLSDGRVYMRYFSSLSLSSRVAHERLVRICFVDYDRVMALVVDHVTGQHRILGVGRLIKLRTRRRIGCRSPISAFKTIPRKRRVDRPRFFRRGFED
jgi:hypothetical protein